MKKEYKELTKCDSKLNRIIFEYEDLVEIINLQENNANYEEEAKTNMSDSDEFEQEEYEDEEFYDEEGNLIEWGSLEELEDEE